MAKSERSNYQNKLISNYYNNLDTIMLQKLAELVTDLYLEQNPQKKVKLWQRTEKAMQNLKIPPAIISHIIEKKDVQILAKNLNDWQKK